MNLGRDTIHRLHVGTVQHSGLRASMRKQQQRPFVRFKVSALSCLQVHVASSCGHGQDVRHSCPTSQAQTSRPREIAFGQSPSLIQQTWR